jgi:uncharacterized protein YkwD
MRRELLAFSLVLAMAACGGGGGDDGDDGDGADADPNGPDGDPGAGEPPELAGITMLHNQVRAGVTTSPAIPPLTWSTSLAATAAAWAAMCVDGGDGVNGLIDHNPNRSDGHPYYVGENIYGSGGASATASGAVSSWAAEESNYNPTTGACSGTCGHYTQVVWRTTREVGCAKHDCAGLTFGSTIVCDYGPGGNTGGPAY